MTEARTPSPKASLFRAANAFLTEKTWEMPYRDYTRADLNLFQTRFGIGWENNRDGDMTMPLSLKTIGNAGYRDQ